MPLVLSNTNILERVSAGQFFKTGRASHSPQHIILIWFPSLSLSGHGCRLVLFCEDGFGDGFGLHLASFRCHFDHLVRLLILFRVEFRSVFQAGRHNCGIPFIINCYQFTGLFSPIYRLINWYVSSVRSHNIRPPGEFIDSHPMHSNTHNSVSSDPFHLFSSVHSF